MNYGNSYKSGYEMCQVNMSGLAIRGLPNKCVPVLGTKEYQCICHSPFLEDLDFKVSNCLKRETSCYNQLCIYGVCKETNNGDDSICICEDEYEGPMCHKKVSFRINTYQVSWSFRLTCGPCGVNVIPNADPADFDTETRTRIAE